MPRGAAVDGFRLAYDRHDAAPEAYSADGQAASVLGLVDELGLDRPVLVGYDVGSRVA